MLASPSPIAVRHDGDATATVQQAALSVVAEAQSASAPSPRPSGVIATSFLVASESSVLADEDSQQSAAPSALPESLGPIGPAVVALAPPPSSLSASADSAKCLAPPSAPPIALATQAQARSFKDGRDNREKQNSIPSSHPIGSTQRALWIQPTGGQRCDHPHSRNTNTEPADDSKMDEMGDDEAASRSAAPAAAASSSNAAASAPPVPPVLPAAPLVSSPAFGLIHPSRVGQLTVGGSSLAVPPVGRRSGAASHPSSSASASSAATVVRSKGGMSAGFASLCKAAKEAAAAAAAAVPVASGAVSSSDAVAAAPLSLSVIAMQPTHCLVFNPVLFNEQCNDRVEHAKAIAAGPSHPMDVQSIVAAWQPSLRDSMHCAFVNRDDYNRVHVQFKTRDSFDRALSSVKSLVPCCVTAPHAQSAWHPSLSHCGLQRHECIERIDIDCAHSGADNTKEAQWIASAAKTILDLAAIDVTTHWIPSTQRSNRLRLSVLARASSVAQLTETVNRINSAGLMFEGHLIRAHAPNVPSLALCNQCSALGHPTDECTEYRGVALRIQWRQPINYAMATQLRDTANAQRVYLGQDLNQRAAHCKLTLLFDNLSDEMVTPYLEQIGERLGAPLLAMQHLIVDTYIVNLRDRLHECTHCGSMDRTHRCESGVPLRRPHVNPRQDAARQQQNNNGAQPNNAAAAPVRDSICRSWSRSKVCPRLTRGDRCGFQHPASLVIVDKQTVCFEWRDSWHCGWGDACKFVSSHAAKPATIAASVVAAAVQAQPPAPAASAQAASAIAPAPAPSPRRSSSSNKKGATRPRAASSAASAAAASAMPDAEELEDGQLSFQTVVSKRHNKANSLQAQSTPVAAPASYKKRKTAAADLQTPTHTPDQPAAAAAGHKPAPSPLPLPLTPLSKSWADAIEDEDEPTRASLPLSSLSSLSSPLTLNQAVRTPLHPPKRPNNQQTSAAAASSSSSSASHAGGSTVQRTLSYNSPAASSSAQPAAAAASSSPSRHFSDAGKGKSATRR